MYHLLKGTSFFCIKNTGKMEEKNTGKVREFCQSRKVGTMIKWEFNRDIPDIYNKRDYFSRLLFPIRMILFSLCAELVVVKCTK